MARRESEAGFLRSCPSHGQGVVDSETAPRTVCFRLFCHAMLKRDQNRRESRRGERARARNLMLRARADAVTVLESCPSRGRRRTSLRGCVNLRIAKGNRKGSGTTKRLCRIVQVDNTLCFAHVPVAVVSLTFVGRQVSLVSNLLVA